MARGAAIPGSIEDMKVVTPEDATAAVASSGNSIFGPKLAQRFWVGTSGDVTLQLDGGTNVLLKDAAAGRWHESAPFKNVQATGTDAVNIVVASVS